MKKIALMIIIAVVAAVLCVIAVGMAELSSAEYAAELAAEQMQIEGSQAYTAYSTITQDITTIQYAVIVCAVVIIIALIYKFFISKE